MEDLMEFPRHKASLHLTHNDHLAHYQTVADFVDGASFGYVDWTSEEQKQKAIETNDCWFLQWHPQTPIDFYVLAAADLNVLLKAAIAMEV